MTNEQILEQQVEALEKLLQLKQAIVAELESKINKLEREALAHSYARQYMPPVSIPSVWTNDPCHTSITGHHNYPTVWMGTNPPCCTNCGKAQPNFISGISSGTITLRNDGIQGNNNVTLTTASLPTTATHVLKLAKE